MYKSRIFPIGERKRHPVGGDFINPSNKSKHSIRSLLVLAAISFLLIPVASCIQEAEASTVTEITIAPGMQYTYTPTFPADLSPTVKIQTQGEGTSGTGGNWGAVSGKTLTVNVPANATPGSKYQVTLRATTTNPSQTLDIPILFNIASSMSATGNQANIVTGSSINFTPSVSGMGSFTWSVTSGKTLPAGLSLDTTTGKVTGIPTGMGDQTIHLTATSSYGETTNLAVTFTILSKLVATNDPTAGAIIYV